MNKNLDPSDFLNNFKYTSGSVIDDSYPSSFVINVENSVIHVFPLERNRYKARTITAFLPSFYFPNNSGPTTTYTFASYLVLR